MSTTNNDDNMYSTIIQTNSEYLYQKLKTVIKRYDLVAKSYFSNKIRKKRKGKRNKREEKKKRRESGCIPHPTPMVIEKLWV